MQMYENFEKHVTLMNEVVDALQKDPDNETYMYALFFRFMRAYPSSHSLLRRYLKQNSPKDVYSMAFQNLVRLGAEEGLLKNSWDKWEKYAEAHDEVQRYQEKEKNRAIANTAIEFTEDANYFLNQVKKRLDD